MRVLPEGSDPSLQVPSPLPRHPGLSLLRAPLYPGAPLPEPPRSPAFTLEGSALPLRAPPPRCRPRSSRGVPGSKWFWKTSPPKKLQKDMAPRGPLRALRRDSPAAAGAHPRACASLPAPGANHVPRARPSSRGPAAAADQSRPGTGVPASAPTGPASPASRPLGRGCPRAATRGPAPARPRVLSPGLRRWAVRPCPQLRHGAGRAAAAFIRGCGRGSRRPPSGSPVPWSRRVSRGRRFVLLEMLLLGTLGEGGREQRWSQGSAGHAGHAEPGSLPRPLFQQAQLPGPGSPKPLSGQQCRRRARHARLPQLPHPGPVGCGA